MPVQFFQKQQKPSLFKPKIIFKHKPAGKGRAAKKEPPKRVFRIRKVTFWTIFCATVLFPLILKVVRAANITGQHGMAVTPPGSSPAGAAGAAAAGVVGAVGAVAAGSTGIALMSGIGGASAAAIQVIGTSFGGAITSASLGAAAATPVLLGIPVFGWIILAVLIIAMAVLMALSMAGVISCDSCSSCGGQQAVAGQSPTSSDTTAVQQGANQQAAYGS